MLARVQYSNQVIIMMRNKRMWSASCGLLLGPRLIADFLSTDFEFVVSYAIVHPNTR